jgi:hypothetical protein
MKKLLVALLLLAVVVAVSYLKVLRQDNRTAQAHDTGYSEGSGELDRVRTQADSLEGLVTDYREALEDSLTTRDSLTLWQRDSLSAIIAAQEDSLKTLAAKQATANRNTSATKKKVDPAKRQQEILAYYKRRYEKLPDDLSPYERRVALTEIKKETARQFSISVSDLDKIREKNKLPY